MNDFSLVSKNILITGASSGLGRQTAITCSQYGANLLVTGRDEQRLEETFQKLNGPGKHKKWIIDLTDFTKVNEDLATIINEFGTLDGAVLFAGSSTTLPLKLSEPSKFEQFFTINVLTSVNLVQLLSNRKFHSASGSSIVMVSSVMAHAGASGKSIYSATKGALLSTSRSMAIELASRNIRINTISPGVVETPMTDKAYYNRDEASRDEIIRQHPLGLGEPIEVANACVFLLSDASKWITGTDLRIDGGYLAQ